MTAPTNTRGYVDPYLLGTSSFASLYTDILEHIPDLTFPLSVPVYGKMRRDPKLSSLVQGWTLNLRRAQWQLDPAGCRPEVVQQVADGMGLAIKGKDEPGPARLRGVSWGDHLAAALRMVPFGFAAFELEADTKSGSVAQLSGLWERPQWTISHIHTDGKTGLLTGATQDQAASIGSPQMRADRMVWYAREREGSNWAGTSLLRPSYASWLIKEEVRRAYAVANVRWSAGVPVMEALPGTNPTAAQMAEAAQMAQAARAGIQAGAASPPGFSMKILGITGSLPNTQEFLRYLDQQCASSALMNAFDLGETPNGSRALGSVLIDALLLALESEAELVADVATRQISARIVDWNWGEDEPVPRVVVSGVGSRREVTAESLNLLLSSGALAADPGLEAWVRREYRLPEREGQAPPSVTAPGADFPDPEAVSPVAKPTVVQAAAGDGQLELFTPPDVSAAEAHFNPNQKRDGDGKWTRAGGGLPGKAGPAGQPSGSATSSTRKTAVGRPLRVRAALAKAKTLHKVEQLAAAEVLKLRRSPVEFRFSTDSDTVPGLRDSHVLTAREHAEGILRIMEEFPRIGLDRVRVAHQWEDPHMVDNTYAYALGNEIVFNLAYSATSNRRAYLASLKEGADAGWHPPGSQSPIVTAIHEAAHILDVDTLGESAHDDAVAAYRKAAKATGKKNPPVSTYAATDTHELIAEAFADVMVNADNAAPASRQIFDVVARDYDDAVRQEARS